jgi:hypothetical protein
VRRVAQAGVAWGVKAICDLAAGTRDAAWHKDDITLLAVSM